MPYPQDDGPQEGHGKPSPYIACRYRRIRGASRSLDTLCPGTPCWWAMRLAPISISCPQCGSQDVLYSCQPSCCFNHVCNNCYTTFELETAKVGESQEAFTLPPDPDPSSPTAPCARCGEAQVFAIVDSASPQFLCVACRALLTLSFTEISPA